jgi:hypothetical protein
MKDCATRHTIAPGSSFGLPLLYTKKELIFKVQTKLFMLFSILVLNKIAARTPIDAFFILQQKKNICERITNDSCTKLVVHTIINY